MEDAVIDLTNMDGESFWVTPHLRYVQLENKVILQQMWQGEKGTQKWENIPTISYDDK